MEATAKKPFPRMTEEAILLIKDEFGDVQLWKKEPGRLAMICMEIHGRGRFINIAEAKERLRAFGWSYEPCEGDPKEETYLVTRKER